MAKGVYYISPTQFAKERRLGVHKVLGFIASGELDAVDCRNAGSCRPLWRIPQTAIEKFESRRSAQPRPKTQRRRKRPNEATGETFGF